MPQDLQYSVGTPVKEEWEVLNNGSTDLTVAEGGTVVLASASVGQVTINLPASSGNLDRAIMVKKTDGTSNAVVVNPNGSETIDGATTYNLTTQYQAVTIVSDGSNWFIV